MSVHEFGTASPTRSATRHSIRLNRFSEETGCEILGKAEFMNPGGSVKDRAARAHHRRSRAQRSAEARRHGRRRHCRQYRHRLRARLQCARLSLRHRDARQPVEREVPDDRNARRRSAAREDGAVLGSESLSEGRRPTRRRSPGAIWANQFDNTANRDAHEQTTGPEIWAQTRRQARCVRRCDRHRRHAGRHLAIS